MIEPGVRNILAGNAEVAAIVNDVAGQAPRIYFALRPQDERRPGIIMYLVSATPIYTFQGRGGYVEGRMQLNCYAPTYPQVKALAQAVRDALDAYTGTSDSTSIARLETDNIRDLPAVPLQGAGEPATYVTAIDLFFAYYE